MFNTYVYVHDKNLFILLYSSNENNVNLNTCFVKTEHAMSNSVFNKEFYLKAFHFNYFMNKLEF